MNRIPNECDRRAALEEVKALERQGSLGDALELAQEFFCFGLDHPELRSLHVSILDRILDAPPSWHTLAAIYAIRSYVRDNQALRRERIQGLVEDAARSGTPIGIVLRSEWNRPGHELDRTILEVRDGLSRFPDSPELQQYHLRLLYWGLSDPYVNPEEDPEEEGRALLDEFEREIAPLAVLPNREHACFMQKCASLGRDPQNPLRLPRMVLTWKVPFWMPGDVPTLWADFAPHTLADLMENVVLHLSETREEQLAGRIRSSLPVLELVDQAAKLLETLATSYPDSLDFPLQLNLLLHLLGVRSDREASAAEHDVLCRKLQQRPLDLNVWSDLAEAATRSDNWVLLRAVNCQRILLSYALGEDHLFLHEELAEDFMRAGWRREALLELILPHEPNIREGCFSRKLTVQGLRQESSRAPYGSIPGEGNHDLYVREALRALEYVGLPVESPDEIPGKRPARG